MGAFRSVGRLAAGWILFSWLACSLTHGGEPRPYRLGVEVVNYDRTVRESLRENIERDLIRRLDRAACFASVGPAPEAPGAADLLLRVVLTDLDDETRYRISQAARDAPNALPDTKRALDVFLEIDLEFQLLKLPGSGVIRVRRQHVNENYRPVMDEDPHDEARYKLIESAVDAASRFACKSSSKKLAREIQALEESASR